MIYRAAIYTPSERSLFSTITITTRLTDASVGATAERRVARNHTVGNHRACRFAPHSAARMGKPIGQTETGETGPVGQVHAPTGIACVDSGGLRAVNAPEAQW